MTSDRDANRARARHIMEQVARVRSVLTDDLLHPSYADNPKAHCYAASEALAHLFRAEGSKVTVHRARVTGQASHWWLEVDGLTVDATADQFPPGYPIPYHLGVATGFLTSKPSQRAAEILRRINQEV